MIKMFCFWKKYNNNSELQDSNPTFNEKARNALDSIITGLEALLSLTIEYQIKPNKRSFVSIMPFFTTAFAIVAGLFALLQYVEQNVNSRIENQEQIFLFIVTNLESNSDVVRVSSIKSLEQMAFTHLISPTDGGARHSITNIKNWLSNNREYYFIDKAREIFVDYAKSTREETSTKYNQESTTILQTGLSWIDKEINIFNKNIKNDELWLFYKADLRQANCPYSNLSDLVFEDVNFVKSDLRASKFCYAYLEKANFIGSYLSQTEFLNATIRGAKFDSSILTFSGFENAIGRGSSFVNCDLSNSRFNNADFSASYFDAANLKNSNLLNANFAGSSMVGVIFTNANLDGCVFNDCDLREADFRNTDVSKIKSITNANIKSVIASEEQLLQLKKLIEL